MKCEHCGAELDPAKAVWLELSWKTNQLEEPRSGLIPPGESQGSFPFGPDCAKKLKGKKWQGPKVL
jgi:hypothetical protein